MLFAMALPLNRIDLANLIREDQQLREGCWVHFVATTELAEQQAVVEGWGRAVEVLEDGLVVESGGQEFWVWRYGSEDWSWETSGLLPWRQSTADDEVPVGMA